MVLYLTSAEVRVGLCDILSPLTVRSFGDLRLHSFDFVAYLERFAVNSSEELAVKPSCSMVLVFHILCRVEWMYKVRRQYVQYHHLHTVRSNEGAGPCPLHCMYMYVRVPGTSAVISF
jgi:hypothetical protein